jgi:glycerophosphoryl diester phosphodiesterase
MKIFAHRGFSYKYPEMTRAAYQAAIEAGVDGFECDVRLTKDKKVICFHDANTKRITGDYRFISRSSAQELIEKANAITLEELLIMAIESKKDLLIETKHPVLSGGDVERRTIDLINQHREEIERAAIEVVIISFSYFAVRRARRQGINAAKVIRYGLGALVSRSKEIAIKITALKRYPFLIRVIKAKRIYVWTVNSKDDLRWLKNREIYGVITDRPKRARRVLKK